MAADPYRAGSDSERTEPRQRELKLQQLLDYSGTRKDARYAFAIRRESDSAAGKRPRRAISRLRRRIRLEPELWFKPRCFAGARQFWRPFRLGPQTPFLAGNIVAGIFDRIFKLRSQPAELDFLDG